MKIGRIEKEKPPVQVRLSVPAPLHERLGDYVRYYRHVHGEEAELKAIMIEMLRSVVDTDRDFQHWLKLESTKPVNPSSTGDPAHPRRVRPDSADVCSDANVKAQIQA
jgi:hypothetical protein